MFRVAPFVLAMVLFACAGFAQKKADALAPPTLLASCVVISAAVVPNMRPPTLAAKLSPVPRK